MHMPRGWSRITLEVKAVRVERVQEISEEDAVAEGCHSDQGSTDGQLPHEEFRELWDLINEKRGFPWESNPWVWVVEFLPLERNT